MPPTLRNTRERQDRNAEKSKVRGIPKIAPKANDLLIKNIKEWMKMIESRYEEMIGNSQFSYLLFECGIAKLYQEIDAKAIDNVKISKEFIRKNFEDRRDYLEIQTSIAKELTEHREELFACMDLVSRGVNTSEFDERLATIFTEIPHRVENNDSE
jgi:hypothetical protein